jgi:hypothetical protein
MRKPYILLFLFTALFIRSNAQNVIVEENFESDLSYIIESFPNGDDATWIDADFDAIPDASGTNRPDDWFPAFGFANADTADVVMASNSWTNSPTPVANYLILPPIHLNDASGMLSWKSAPFQTPRYLDGLQVLVSTTGNFDAEFTDTLMKYAEFISGDAGADSTFSNFTFSDGFVFGLDGQYLEYDGDSIRFHAILRPDSASLAAYAGKDIYIAFCHGTTDDNLMSIDDIRVTGNGNFVAVSTPETESSGLNIFPNPTADLLTINYSLASPTQVKVDIMDESGHVVKNITHGTQLKGAFEYHIDLTSLTPGQYMVVLKTSQTTAVQKFTRL